MRLCMRCQNRSAGSLFFTLSNTDSGLPNSTQIRCSTLSLSFASSFCRRKTRSNEQREWIDSVRFPALRLPP